MRTKANENESREPDGMIHYRPACAPCSGHGGSAPAPDRRRELFVAVEVSLLRLRQAKRAADDSLRRAQEAPEPHATTNSIFVSLYEEHLRDREALFEAMRRLDEAQQALRDIAAGIGPTPEREGPGRLPAG